MKDFSSGILKTDQLSCGCSSEDGDTLPWEGRKCWYPERHNSRSIHPSTQATSNIELKTSKNISTDSTLLVENSFSTACGEKKGVQDFNFGPKKFQLRKLHLVAHAFRFSSFLSRRPCCVCSRRGMAPFLLVSDSYLKNFWRTQWWAKAQLNLIRFLPSAAWTLKTSIYKWLAIN